MPTLSFCILDDLRPYYGPIHYDFDGSNDPGELMSAIISVLAKFSCDNNHGDDYCIDSYIYKFVNDLEYDIIKRCLLDDDYLVYNRVEKYYVVAFAIDFTRFEVFSKDCDKEIISWHQDDKNDHIKGIITDPNYNENPIVRMLKKLNVISDSGENSGDDSS